MINDIERDADLWNAALGWKLFGKPLPAHYSDVDGAPSRAFWNNLFGDHQSLADLPAIVFVQELLNAYPEAKVVLVERDAQRWYTSFEKAVINNMWSPIIRILHTVDVAFLGRIHSISSRWRKGFFKAESKEQMQRNAISIYQEHYTLVRKLTPSHRLLEFEVSDGWEPLCLFLGKNVPEESFPRANDSEAIQKAINGYMLISLKGAAVRGLRIVAMLGIVVLAGTWLRG